MRRIDWPLAFMFLALAIVIAIPIGDTLWRAGVLVP